MSRHSSSVETFYEGTDEEVPAVDEDEEDYFEGEGHEYGGQHHHAHGHEGTGDDHVDDEEGNVDDEAHGEGGAHFADDEGGYQDGGGYVVGSFGTFHLGYLDEECQVFGIFLHLEKHEVAYRSDTSIPCFGQGSDFAVDVGLNGFVIYSLVGGCHDKKCEEESQPH